LGARRLALPPMGGRTVTFYDDWLGLWDQAAAEKKQARKWTHEEDIEWVETVQDYRTGLLIAPELGFRTWGTESLISEIPPGCHTGQHKHGEESIHIVRGSGFSIVNGVRYDWKTGSTLNIPFGAVHQHFNTGPDTARYFSAMSVHLEHFCGLHRHTQLEEKGEISHIPNVVTSANGYDDRGRRIRLNIEDAPVRIGSEDRSKLPQIEPGKPLVLGTLDGMDTVASGHKAKLVDFMRIGRTTNDFQALETEISGILTDAPLEYGGTHAHMEAHLYILDGEGHSIVDGESIAWKTGSAFHVVGPQTVHQHINDAERESQMLRVAFGIRYFWEKIAKEEFPYLYLAYREQRDRQSERERERERVR
jgi:quercetin dioxygenase-like cupin family protein